VEQWLGVRLMLSNAWKDICCIRDFIEGVGVASLLFCDQYFVLVKYLHV